MNEENISAQALAGIEVADGCVTLAMAFITADRPHICAEMFDCVQVMVNKLHVLPVAIRKLADRTAKLSEAFWSGSLPGREQLVPQTATYLLNCALNEGGRVSDVKRVYAFRDALTLLEYEGADAVVLRQQLVQCAVSPLFLSVPEGKRFISTLFGLHPDLIDQLHAAIKATLPLCPQAFVEDYADVYYRAWRAASGIYLARIEGAVVQDLMDRAVHAQRGPGGGLASTLRTVLKGFTSKKKERGVDEMMCRLYSPIIWRALKAANGIVRANAAALLIDAFPLSDPEAPVADADALLQRQVDAFKSMLEDTSPLVRATGVEGVCRVASVYWELLPPATIGTLLGKIVGDLARDAAAAHVRVATVKGMDFLLDNHHAVPLLQKLLPQLRDLCHDPSERVRGVFLNLLLTIKGMRGIKFWDVAPVEHLLARLNIESKTNAGKIVQLLAPTYFPLNKKDVERVERCLALVRSNLPAGRRFYQLLADHVPSSALARFSVAICKCVHATVSDIEDLEASFSAEAVQEGDIAPADCAPLMDIVAVIVTGFSVSGSRSRDKSTFAKLEKALTKPLGGIIAAGRVHDPLMAACMQVARAFPANIARAVKLDVVADLREVEIGTEPLIFAPMLECAVAWNCDNEVVTHAMQNIKATLVRVEEDCTDIRGKNKAGKRGKKDASLGDVKSCSLSLAFLDSLISIYARSSRPSQAHKRFSAPMKMLKQALPLIQKRLEGDAVSAASDDILSNMVRLYLKMCLGCHTPKTTADAELVSVLAWAKDALLGPLSTPIKSPPKKQAGRKRNAQAAAAAAAAAAISNDGHIASQSLMCTPLIHSILSVVAEAITLGAHSVELVEAACDFAECLFASAASAPFVGDFGRVAAQVAQASHGAPNTHVYDTYLRAMLKTLFAACVSDNTGSATKSIMPLLTASARALQQRRMLSEIMVLAAEAVVIGLEAVKDEDVHAPLPLAVLPLTSLAVRNSALLAAFVGALPDPHGDAALCYLEVRVLGALATAAPNGAKRDAAMAIIRTGLEGIVEHLSFEEPPEGSAAADTIETAKDMLSTL